MQQIEYVYLAYAVASFILISFSIAIVWRDKVLRRLLINQDKDDS